MSFDPEDDADLLEQELNENETRMVNGRTRGLRWYERSLGGRVMLVWGALLWLVLMALTMKGVQSATNLAAVGVLVVMGLEGLLAVWLSRVIWRGIGARPRMVLRWATRAWPLVLPLVCLLTARIAAPFLVEQEKERRINAGATAAQAEAGVVGATAGANWKMVLDAREIYRLASHDEALAACAALGDGFRLPRVNDLSLLNPTPRAPNALAFWLAELEQQSSRFHLEKAEPTKGNGRNFGLLMDGPNTPAQAAILCARIVTAAPVVVAPATPTFAGAVKQELSCSLEADTAARFETKPFAGEQLARALKCWAEAQATQQRSDDTIVPLAKATTLDERLSALLHDAETEGPTDAVLEKLTSSELLERQAAELALWRWAHAHPKDAKAQTADLLARAGKLPQTDDPLTKLAHALAVAVGSPEACALLAQRALDGPWPRNPADDALQHVRGACAQVAAKVLGDHQRATGFARNLKWVSAVRALGAAAGPQVLETETKQGPRDSEGSFDVWEALLESELVRRNGFLPPRAQGAAELPGLEPLGLITRACTQADFGLKPKDRLPFPDDRCVKSLNAGPLKLLREGFVPLVF